MTKSVRGVVGACLISALAACSGQASDASSGASSASACPYTEMLFVTECRGMAPSPPPRIPGEPEVLVPAPSRVPICQPCLIDAHCDARASGRCVTPARTCGAAARVCQYPGDPCYPGACTMSCIFVAPLEVTCSPTPASAMP